MTVEEIATWLEGEIVGDRTVKIARVAKIEEAGPEDLTFLSNPKYERHLATTNAAAVLVSNSFDAGRHSGKRSPVFIKVRDPYFAFLQVLKRLMPGVDPLPVGIHPTAVVAPSAKLGNNVALGAFVVIDDGVVVGDSTRIGHGTVVGRDTTIGAECLIYPHVTIYHRCALGSRVTIHSGTIVGSDGFGFAPRPDGTYEKIPQLGSVVIEDDVEIGSNCCIDRATLGATTIRKGAKLDNLIQIAHNCEVGENTVIAAQTGLAGSTKLGRNVMVGGQVGFAGHMEIADRSVVLAQSGITKSIRTPGGTYFGYPAKEHRKAQRMEVALRMLPDLLQEFRDLKQKVEELLKRTSGQ